MNVKNNRAPRQVSLFTNSIVPDYRLKPVPDNTNLNLRFANRRREERKNVNITITTATRNGWDLIFHRYLTPQLKGDEQE